jgi:hypothetical protein
MGVMTGVSGGCLCGKVRIAAQGQPYRIGICHCEDCKKHHGALFHASAIYPEDAVTIDGKVAEYQGRFFCPHCGASVYSRSGDEVEVNLGVLEGADHLIPSYELWTNRRAAWLPAFPVRHSYPRDRITEGRAED